MNFRIADTFTDSLTRLTGDEQKAVKTTAFDLQLNPANPGLRFHKLDKAKDKNFWSVRVSADIRLIVHRMPSSLMLCYVDHHDKAYAWAERRKLEVHPTTGAAQIVELRERIEEITVPVYVTRETVAHAPAPTKEPAPLFAARTDDELLAFGVPAEWLADVRAATEDTILEVADHLPQEAAEALIDLATGVAPRAPAIVAPAADPFAHPDAQRRFRVVTDVDELARALEYPWDKWTIFLHPAQREIVERTLSGPARVSGSAGTGKTIVALHRAAFLARADAGARVLLTTLSDTLASALRTKLRRLISNQPELGERIDVDALDVVALRLYAANIAKPRIAGRDAIIAAIVHASRDAGNASAARMTARFSAAFLLAEWEQIVDAWHVRTWESYRDVARIGRRTRLPEKQRAELWAIYAMVIARLAEQELMTMADVYHALSAHYASSDKRPFDHVVVDEAQDLSVAQLRFLAGVGAGRPTALFFPGDIGQRILQPPFSWKQLGVDIRGRSSTLRINYRTSHQIRRHADRLLDESLADIDGNEERRDAISVFNGPPPVVTLFADERAEVDDVARWLRECVDEGVSPTEIGVFVRSAAQIARATQAMTVAAIPYRILDERVQTVSGSAAAGTMHLAKGLQFRAVAVMGRDDEVLPLQERIEAVGDEAELEEVFASERHLLYVACTRARDRLSVSAVAPGSEFLADLR